VTADLRRVVLPLAPGTARCLTCAWVPWPWLDLPADAQARQHTATTRHPTIYPSRWEKPTTAHRANSDPPTETASQQKANCDEQPLDDDREPGEQR
jgi:hypothetical protein